MAALPSDLSLNNIADGAPIVAADHRNNYTAIQSGFNALNDLLAGGTSGQVLVSGGPTAAGWATTDTVYRKTTEKAVASSTAEADLLNGEVTVAAGVMGTVGVVRAYLQGDYLDNVGNTVTLKLKFGGTTWWQGTFTVGTSATRRPWTLDLAIANLGATNAQDAHATFALGGTNAPTTGLGPIQPYSSSGGTFGSLSATKGALTVDTTSAAAVAVTCTHSQNSASVSMRLESAYVVVTS